MKEDLDRQKKYDNPKIKIFSYLLAITFLFTFICNDKYFNVGNYSLFPLIIIIFGSINIFLYIIKTRTIMRFRLEQYCVIFILFYIVFITYLVQYSYNFDTVMAYGMLFLMFLIISVMKFNKKEVYLIVKCYILSAIILSFILVIQRRMPYDGIARFSVFYSQSDYYDVNFLAAYICIPGLIALNNAIIQFEKRLEIKYYIISGFILLAILLTGSRAGLLGFIIGAILILLINKRIKFSLIISIFLICFIIYSIVPNELIERFFINSYNDGSNNKRILDWMYGWETFKRNPILGTGMVWPIEAIRNLFSMNITVHNTYIGILMQFGIIGGIPIILLLLNPIIKLYKTNQKGIIGILISLFFLLTMIEAQSSIVFFFPLIIIYLISNVVINTK